MTKQSSIDQKELHKFNRTYEQWWDKSGEFKTLHDINPVRIKYITEKIIKHFDSVNDKKAWIPACAGMTPSGRGMTEGNLNLPLKGLDILDVGCGGGIASVPMYKLGAKVTGIDANENNIKASDEYAKKYELDINFVNTTVEEYTGTYDVVLCLEVIEHVANPEEFVHNLTKLLAPSGLLILSTINRTVKSYLQAIIMAEYVLRWMPAGTHDYAKFVKPSELKNMLGSSKFHIEELKGLKLNPLTNSWYMDQDIDVNYFACIVL